jgi:hypothetical protein
MEQKNAHNGHVQLSPAQLQKYRFDDRPDAAEANYSLFFQAGLAGWKTAASKSI